MYTEEQKKMYLIYYIELKKRIEETYRYYAYLKYLEENKERYKNISAVLFFPKDLCLLIKNNICLNMFKIVLDNDKDCLSFNKMKNFVIKNLNTHIVLEKVDIPDDVVINIRNIRNNMIAHDLNNKEEYSVFITNLKVILDKVAQNFNKLNIKDITNEEEYFTQKLIDRIEELSLNSINNF